MLPRRCRKEPGVGADLQDFLEEAGPKLSLGVSGQIWNLPGEGRVGGIRVRF